MNLSDTDRVAILNAVTPTFLRPMGDSAEVFRMLVSDEALLAKLSEREKADVAQMMAGTLVGASAFDMIHTHGGRL